jgi:hypothetical protein
MENGDSLPRPQPSNRTHESRRTGTQGSLWTFGFSCFIAGYLVAATGWVLLGNPSDLSTKRDPGEWAPSADSVDSALDPYIA